MDSRHTEDEPFSYIEIVPADDPFGDFSAEPAAPDIRTVRTPRTPRTSRTVRLIGIATLSSMATTAVLLVFRSEPPVPGSPHYLAARGAIGRAAPAVAVPAAGAPLTVVDGVARRLPPPPGAANAPWTSVPTDLELPLVQSAGESQRVPRASAFDSQPPPGTQSLEVTALLASALPGSAPGPDAVPSPARVLETTPGTAAPPVAGVVTPTAAIESVLSRYASSFNALDARGAKAVWPAVNERNLARAFDSLDQQELDLGDCNITVASARATASCDGIARYVPKVGSRRVRAEKRQWTFVLQGGDSGWSIENVAIRQP